MYTNDNTVFTGSNGGCFVRNLNSNGTKSLVISLSKIEKYALAQFPSIPTIYSIVLAS